MRNHSADAARLATAVAAVALASALRAVTHPWLSAADPFALFYAAVMISAYFGGLAPGLLATALSAVVVNFVWLDPGGLRFTQAEDSVNISLFLVVAGFISYLCGSLRRARRGAEDALAAAAAEAQARAKAEHHSENQFRIMANSAPVMVWIADASGCCYWFNKSWLDFTGKSVEENADDQCASNVHPDDLPHRTAQFRQSFAARASYTIEYRLRRDDGQYRWLLENARPLYNASGIFTGYIGSCVDVTERKAANDRLNYQLQLTQLIAENAAESLFLLDAEGNVTFMNRSAELMFGYTRAELMGMKLHDHLHHGHPDGSPYPSEECPLATEYRSGKVLTDHEDVFFRKDGSTVDVSCSNAPIVVDGVVTGAVLVAHDISRRKKAEEQRDQLLMSERSARSEAERASRMKDEFLSTLSHELRTPLNAILGWAQILRMGDGTEGDELRGIEVIERNALVQAQLIDDLLDMSRIVSGKIRFDLKQLDMADVVEAAVESVRHSADAKGLVLDALVEEGHIVAGDPARLQQVVWNLLTNAIKFTPRGGHVQITLAGNADYVSLIVRDSGQGIKTEFLDFVFDRFRQADATTTRRYGGMGLGLAIVKQLVELHGGSVSASSEGEGRGATFSVTLPIAAPRAEAHVATPVENAVATVGDRDSVLRGLKILVVDDEPDARDLVRLLLQDCDAEVVTAASFDEALELFAREKPDVIVTDIGMPVHDGYELLARIRSSGSERGAAVPAIALTAFARPEDRQRSRECGFAAHVAKPMQAAELIAVVASVSGRARQAIETT